MTGLLVASFVLRALLIGGEGGNSPVPVIDKPPTVFLVEDSEPNGIYNDADIEAALTACTAAAPAWGCEIVLGGHTYADVHVEIPPHVRVFRGEGDASVLLGASSPSGDPIILREPRDGGWPTVFRDFKIDGNKQALTSDPGNHNCIKVGDPTATTLASGSIIRVTCESVAKEGFQIEDAPGWTFRDNVLRYLGCHDGENADGGAISDWEPNGINADLMKCGTWGASVSDDDNQPGRKTPGIGIEVQRNSDDALIVGNLVEYFTKIGIQGIDSIVAPEASYPARGVVRGNTVQWGLSGIALVRTNDWVVDDNDVFDIGASWQFGNVGAGTSCSFAGRRSQFTNNDVRRTAGSGMGIACDCGATIGGSFACGVVVTGNTITDACQGDTTYGTIFADVLGTLGTAVGITITGNSIVSSDCLTDLNIDGYSDVVTDL